jgi:hypothetical protein
MKRLLILVSLLAFATLAQARNNDNHTGSHDDGCQGNCPTTTTTGGTTTNTATSSLSATLNGGKVESTNINTARGGDANQGQLQGQKQRQGQDQNQRQGQDQTAVGVGVGISEGSTAKAGSSSGGNTFSVYEEATKATAASAPSVIAAAAASCALGVGGSGQGLLGGGALTFSFEGVDCKVIREASLMAGLGYVEAAVQHTCHIARMAKTWDLVGKPCKTAKPIVAGTSTGRR